MTSRSRLPAACLGGLVVLALAPVAVSAQELDEVCPDAQPGTGATWGLVADIDSGIGLPGATVVATWERDGAAERSEAQTALDGGYVLCGLPLDTELSVQPMVASVGGPVVLTMLSEAISRVDLGFSLTGVAGEDDRVWACPGDRSEEAGRMASRHLRCDSDWPPLETCPREQEHGAVEAALGQEARSRDVLLTPEEIRRLRSRIRPGAGAIAPLLDAAAERLAAAARRLGANALINFERDGTTIRAEAVTITVDPATCQ